MGNEVKIAASLFHWEGKRVLQLLRTWGRALTHSHTLTHTYSYLNVCTSPFRTASKRALIELLFLPECRSTNGIRFQQQ